MEASKRLVMKSLPIVIAERSPRVKKIQRGIVIPWDTPIGVSVGGAKKAFSAVEVIERTAFSQENFRMASLL